MVTTNDRGWWSAMWSFKDHGKSWDPVYERAHPPAFRWVHESFGTNWRMLETQAAIGRIQLRRMPAWSAQRRANAQKIAAICRTHPAVRVPAVPTGVEYAYHKFHAFIGPERLAEGWTRERIVDEIGATGVPCLQGTCPEVYMEQAFAGTGFRPRERLKVARE